MKIIKELEFELELRTSTKKQNIFYTLFDEIVNVTISSLSLHIPTFLPSSEIHMIIEDAYQKTFTLSFESLTKDRKPSTTGKQFQLDIQSSSVVNAPLFFIAAHQKTERIDPAELAKNLWNKRFKMAIFDNVSFKKYFAEIDGIIYPKGPNNFIDTENFYLNQYRDLKFFYEEIFGEQLLSPVITYDKKRHLIIHK